MTHNIMTDEQTNATDTQGTKPNSIPEEPISLYDKTEAIVQRQEAANKEAKEILDRQEKLHANQRLAGTTGGHIEAPAKEDTSKEYADKVMKGEVKPE